MGPLEPDRRKVHPTSSPGDEGFPSASSVPATLHSPPSARLLRGSDLVPDTQALQLAHSCAIGSRRNQRRLIGGAYQLTAFVSGSPSHDPRHDDGPTGFVPLEGRTLEF